MTSIRSAVPSKLPYGKRDERKKNSAGTGVPRRLDSSDGHRLYLLMRASFHELRGLRSTTLGGCSGICAVDLWTAAEICKFYRLALAMRCGRLGYSAIVGDMTCFEPPGCSKANRSYEAIRFCGTKPSFATSLDAMIRLMLGKPAHRSSSIIRPRFGIFGRLTLTFCRGLDRTVRLISWFGKRAKLAWDSSAATSDPCSVFREVVSLSLAADMLVAGSLGLRS